MSRNSSWVRTISDKASWRQDQGLSATIYIVREVGPTGFILKEESFAKTVKVLLGDPHSCSCAEFRKDKDLCRHICWLLLKRFRIPREDPISWQLGLVEREINALLQSEERRKATRNRPETARKDASAGPLYQGKAALEQREITQGDTCPICMEELLHKREPVTYCKYSCANSIHIKCMKIWAEHQASSGEKIIKCPFCREDFGPHEYLREEYRNTVVPNLQRNRIPEHLNTLCRVCSQSPIKGKCYRCLVCNEYHLCQKCFNTPTHQDHSFEFRVYPGQRWRPAQRVSTNGLPLPSALVDNLMSREISEQDYDVLLQLDNPAASELSQIPESVIKKFPLEKVRTGSRHLGAGEQCCVCLRAYQIGDFVRRLPCHHKFHRDCIDNWLLHQHPTCPVDGQIVWSSMSEDDPPPRIRRRHQVKKRATQSQVQQSTQVALEIPGIGIARIHPTSAPVSRTSQPAPTSVLSEFDRTNEIHRQLSVEEGSINSHVVDSTSRRESDETYLPISTQSLLQLVQEQYPEPQSPNIAQLDSRSRVEDVYSGISNRTNALLNTRLTNTDLVTQSDSEIENRTKRKRNITLASRVKKTSRNNNLSTPSIATQQPVGVSTLYLGNGVDRLTTELNKITLENIPTRQRRVFPHKQKIPPRNTTSALDGNTPLLIDNQISSTGTRQVTEAATALRQKVHKLKSSKAPVRPIAHQLDLASLELNGTNLLQDNSFIR